jgi:Zn-dependent peptidase ImmA (M78 family)
LAGSTVSVWVPAALSASDSVYVCAPVKHIDLAESDPPGYDWEVERAANEFAAELLMPRDMVVREFDQSPDTQRLAKRFKVSELAMGYRLVNLGLR